MKIVLIMLTIISLIASILMVLGGASVLAPLMIIGFIVLFAFFLGINVVEGLESKKSKLLVSVLSFYILGVIDAWLIVLEMSGVVLNSYNIYSPLDGVGVEMAIVSTALFYMHKFIGFLKEEFKKQNKSIFSIVFFMFMVLVCLFWFGVNLISTLETIYRVF